MSNRPVLDRQVARFRDELSARVDRLEHTTSMHFMCSSAFR